MKKILVIEDDLDIAMVVELALNHIYEVKTETDNNHIMEAFDDFVPDLILIDNYIGQMQANQIMGNIKTVAAYKNIPFVLFSGHHDIERLANELNAQAYLAKPFDLGDLQKCVDGVLSNCA